MIKKTIAIVLQLLMIFCIIYSTFVQESIIPYYIFFPLWIIFGELFEKVNLKKRNTVIVCAFYLLEFVYALFLYWKKVDYISYFYPLIVAVMYIIIDIIKWLLKNKVPHSVLLVLRKR